jgi:hypothetical protein
MSRPLRRRRSQQKPIVYRALAKPPVATHAIAVQHCRSCALPAGAKPVSVRSRALTRRERGGVQPGSRSPDWRGNRIVNENERLAMPHRKFVRQCIQIGVLQLVMTWQQLDQRPATYIKETNMQEMTNFARPIELSNEELDLVAAGGGCGCSGGGDNQVGLVNVDTGNINILSGNNIAVLSAGFKQESFVV